MSSTSQDRIYGANSSLAVKAPCLAATTGNITLSGEQTIDGVAIVTGDRVLVWSQTSGVDNGIYIADTSTWERAPDFDGTRDVTKGTMVLVASGTTYSNSIFRVTTSGTITIGTTSIAFALSGLTDSANMDFIQEGTGAVTRTAQAKMREIVSVLDYGVTMDGTTDDLTALNVAIARLNDNTIKGLYIPEGTMAISAAPNAITRSNWSITGAGPGATTIKMLSTSGTAGTFWTIGNGSTTADNWSISNLRLWNDNSATLNGTGNCFNLVNSSDGFVDNIVLVTVNGLATLGDGTTTATRPRFTSIEASMYGPAGGTFIKSVLCNGLRCDGLRVAISGTATAALRGIVVQPTGSDTCDSGIFSNCEFNFPDKSCQRIVVLDGTNGIIANHFFTNCIFDHSTESAIQLLIDAGAVGTARISNAVFTGCRAVHEDDGGPIVLDNTGAGTMWNVQFNGGFYRTWDVAAARLTGAVQATFAGVQFEDAEKSTEKYGISAAAGNISVTDCTFRESLGTGTCKFTYAVGFSATAVNVVVAGNNANSCTKGVVDTANLGVASVQTRTIGNNIGTNVNGNVTVTSSSTSATTLANISLENNRTYHIGAKVFGVKLDGNQRGSFDLIGTFYRSSGGVATLQGAVTSLHAVASSTAWAATMTVSGNTAQVRVTADSTVATYWGAVIDQRSIGST